jgi:hypothetical protein
MNGGVMMLSAQQDRSYFMRRAKQERSQAPSCSDHSAALVHLRLAEEYERRAIEIASDRHAVPVVIGAAD